MEDVKWLLKKYGFLIVLMVVIVVICSIIFGKRGSEKNAEEVWEPPVEIPFSNENEILSNNIAEENIEESETESESKSDTESSLWFLPQAENCLITESEKDELKDRAMEAAGQVKDVYKDIELEEGVSYGSNIKEFTKEQRREAVALLGNAGFVSVTEDTNMENYEEIEDFYAAYMEKRDVMVTIYEVNRDGLIGAVTFIYRDNRLQTYYVGIGWQEGGIPEIKDTLVSDIAEIKLTEKGYLCI